MSGMNLYVWENVLHDHTPGMAVAFGRTRQEAVESIPSLSPIGREELMATAPKVVPLSPRPAPNGWYVTGGG